jgi:hypothetical protein
MSITNWNKWAKWLKENGYKVWQTQYRWNFPEGYHAWFIKLGFDDIEVYTFSEEVYNAIIKY